MTNPKLKYLFWGIRLEQVQNQKGGDRKYTYEVGTYKSGFKFHRMINNELEFHTSIYLTV